MRQSETTSKILGALVKAQGEISNLYPSSKGYGYSYVPLEKIIDMLKLTLPKHGLGYIQLPCGGDANTIGLTTRVFHESGEWIEDTATFQLTDMKGVNKSQATGAALTYFRRYALCAAFGITGDADVDASDKALTQGRQAQPQNHYSQETVQNVTINLQAFIDNGLLDSRANWKNRALDLIKKGDVDGMQKCIEYCKSLEKEAS